MKQGRIYSIIIPTLNGGGQFKQLLDALSRQSLWPDCELIVIDSGSRDQTLDWAKARDAKIVSVSPKQFNHGATRNQGIENSHGEWIFLFTQDAQPADAFVLEKMLAAMDEFKAAGVYARQRPCVEASPLVRRDVERWISGSQQPRVTHFTRWEHFLQLPPMQRYLACVFDNVASLIRRDVWQRIPFPHTAFGEDIEWAFRALCNGYTIVYAPQAQVYHSHERSPRYAYQRTRVDHARLFYLFGLRTIPARRHAVQAFFKTVCADYAYLLGHCRDSRFLSKMWWKNFAQIPLYAYNTVMGQYHGAKLAAEGHRLAQSNDV